MDSSAGELQPLSGAITIEHEAAGRRVLRLSGDLDAAVVAQFRDLQGRNPVVVEEIDAGPVTFIGSSGLAVMWLCAEASLAAGHRPVLRAASHPVERALRLAGMEGAFPRPERAPERTAHTR